MGGRAVEEATVTDHLQKLLIAARRRARWVATLHFVGDVCFPTAMFIAAVAVTCHRVMGTPIGYLWLALFTHALYVGWIWVRPVSIRRLARTIDVHFDLHDELGNAFELEARTHTGQFTRPRPWYALLVEASECTSVGHRRPFGAALATATDQARGHPRDRWHLPDALLVPAYGASPNASPIVNAKALGSSPMESGRPHGHGVGGRHSAIVCEELAREDDKASQVSRQVLDVLEALENGQMDVNEALEQPRRS